MKITYWDKSKDSLVKNISKERNLNVGYFTGCKIDGISKHYPLPLIRTSTELLLPTIEKFMSLGRGTVYEQNMEWTPKLSIPTKFEESSVFYFAYNCANYYHWVYDTIPYLYIYFLEKKKDKNLKLLVSPPEGQTDLYPFVYETFEMLNIKKSDLIFLNEQTLYKKIIIGSSLTHNRQSLKPPHPNLFTIIDSMKGTKSNIDRIYISRRTWTRPKSENIGTDYTMQRQCVNEDEVVDLFEKYGFKEIFCEDLTMKEKVGLFKSAKIVAGPIGGGLCNAIFCKPTTKLISINSPEYWSINKRLEYAMSHTKLYHFDDTEFVDRKQDVVTGKSALSISGGMNSPWRANLDSLSKLLEKIA